MDASSSDDNSGDGKAPARRRPRFLGDIDRRLIIHRLDHGEKQADVAREFGVTRAAICHISKNRDEILTRFEILVKSPRGRQMVMEYLAARDSATTTTMTTLPFVVRSLGLPQLVKRLHASDISITEFRALVARVTALLLEQALIGFGVTPTSVVLSDGSSVDGVTYARPSCALALGQDADAMRSVFHELEPTAATGHLCLAAADLSRCLQWKRARPLDLGAVNVVLLTPVADDATTLVTAIKVLESHGVCTKRLCVVALSAVSHVVQSVYSAFPDVAVVAADGGDALTLQSLRDRRWTLSPDALAA
ncbi:hypothetical protein PINS_up010712 [Pythium insidiosum]|nr:hypothetical protein PINS_up010712 [Pythium insidiosum]